MFNIDVIQRRPSCYWQSWRVMRKDGCADDQPRWFRGTGRTSCGHLFFKGNRFVSVSIRVWESHTLIVNNIFVFVFVFFCLCPYLLHGPVKIPFYLDFVFKISKIQVLGYVITKISSGSKCPYLGHIFNNTDSRKVCLPIRLLSDNIVFHMELLEIGLANWL